MTDLALTLLIAIPLLGAVAVATMPARLAKSAGLTVSLLTLLWAVVGVLMPFEVGGGMQLREEVAWIAPLGVNYSLGVDALGLMMVLLTSALVPIVMVAAWRDTDTDDALDSPGDPDAGFDPTRARGFVALALALEGLSLAVFLATDVFLFYIVFEATLIPAYFLIGGYGREGRGRAAIKFLIYQLAGGLIMLGAVIGLYVVSAQAGSPTYSLEQLSNLNIDETTQRWLFLGFFIPFAIKAPLFPVHTWLADTTEKATPATSVLLVCVLDKIGTFGMLRFCLGIFPEASVWATPVVVVLALISIIYGALVAIGQDDLLRMIGLTSLSHFGFIVLGIFVFTNQGGSGAILYMVNHGISTAALFLVAGFLISRSGTASISRMTGVEKVAPVLAGLFLVAGLAACGLPGLSTFVSEFLVIVSAFDYAWWAGAVAVLAIVLAAVYVLRAYQRIMTGPEPSAPAGASWHDLDRREVGALAPLVLALVLFGFYPAPLLDVINPHIERTLTQVDAGDDGPVVPPGERPSTQEGDR